MSETSDHPVTPAEPAWDVARLFPDQGAWSEQDYLALDTNRLVEYSDGVVEFLPMPTLTHQLILLFLYQALHGFVSGQGLGTLLVAPYRVKLRDGKYREPDLVFIGHEHRDRLEERCSDGADLVMEVVSEEGRGRDLEIKRAEYARAGIPEYWIVDPQSGRVTVLALEGEAYAVHGEFARGESASSRLLPGFAVDVEKMFDVKP